MCLSPLILMKLTRAKFCKFSLKMARKPSVHIKYELKERTPNSSLRESYTSKDVFYLIMPDCFANGDEKNDSSKSLIEKANRKSEGGRHGGDLRGIINNLDYLKNLGATTLSAYSQFAKTMKKRIHIMVMHRLICIK